MGCVAGRSTIVGTLVRVGNPRPAGDPSSHEYVLLTPRLGGTCQVHYEIGGIRYEPCSDARSYCSDALFCSAYVPE